MYGTASRKRILCKLRIAEQKKYEFPLHLNGELFHSLFFSFQIINEIKIVKLGFNDQHQTMFHHRHQAVQHQQFIVHFKLRGNFFSHIIAQHIARISSCAWMSSWLLLTSSDKEWLLNQLQEFEMTLRTNELGNGNSQKPITV